MTAIGAKVMMVPMIAMTQAQKDAYDEVSDDVYFPALLLTECPGAGSEPIASTQQAITASRVS